MIDKSPMVLRAMLLEAESRSRVYSFARIKLATALGIPAIKTSATGGDHQKFF